MSAAGWPEVLQGDCREVLKTLPSESVHCCVTSPPYWGLRDYGTGMWEGGSEECDHQAPSREAREFIASTLGGGKSTQAVCEAGTTAYRAVCGKCGARRIDQQIGLEETPEAHVAVLVEVFREVWRVLRPDGTLWLNYGDCYNSQGGHTKQGATSQRNGRANVVEQHKVNGARVKGLKPKDLVGMPWRVAFALQAEGWYLRSDIIWSKGNPMPESVQDRPTRSHEYLFLLSKQAKYWYDADAIREEQTGNAHSKGRNLCHKLAVPGNGVRNNHSWHQSQARHHDTLVPGGRNKRTVWEINPQPTPEAHFATFPEKLIEPCILAGTSERGCCPVCGAGWVRVVENTRIQPKDYEGKYAAADPQANGRRMLANVRARREAGEPHDNPFPTPKTTGWQPSCAHPHTEAETVPAVVLDPFGGSGTVGKVATRLGRRSILIDLNPDYLKIAAKRTAQGGLGL